MIVDGGKEGKYWISEEETADKSVLYGVTFTLLKPEAFSDFPFISSHKHLQKKKKHRRYCRCRKNV
jgi:hypothetical protein